MSATALLLLLIAIFVIFNAPNFVEVILGNAKISFLGKGQRSQPSDRTVTTNPDGSRVAGGTWGD